MPFDLENDLRILLASAPQNKHLIPVVEMRHSALSKTYWLWRETRDGWVRLEDTTAVPVEPLNMQIGTGGYHGHLDQTLEIRIDTVDVENKLRNELARIPLTTTENIVIVYREYISDNLEEPMLSVSLIAESINMERGVATINAVAPRFSVTRTGELYDTRTIPMLRAFL